MIDDEYIRCLPGGEGRGGCNHDNPIVDIVYIVERNCLCVCAPTPDRSRTGPGPGARNKCVDG